MALINSANGLLLSSKTPVSSLQEILLRSNITPEYELVYNGVGTHDPIFKYKLTAGSCTVIGSGKSKKEAKHDAASTFLSRMKYFNALTENGTTQPQDNIELTSPYSGALKENVVGMLNDLCILNNLPMPEYVPLKEEGPPHARMFTFQCRLSSIVETAVSRTKKQAKHMVSQQMINRLSEILGDKLVPVPDKSTDIDDDDDLGPTVPLVPLENTRKSRYNWGLKLSLYHYKLADDSINFPLRIDIGEELKDKSLEWVDQQTDHENILDRLLEELDYTKEVIHLGPKCLLHNLHDLKLDDIPDAWLEDDEEENVEDTDSNSVEENTDVTRISENLEEKLTIQDEDHSENGADEPGITLLLRINGVLPFVFYGSGTSEKEAIHKATVQALKFYCLMAKSKSHVHS